MYEIIFGNKTVGNATVKKEGLYYKITCVCNPPSRKLHRITVGNGTTEIDLGICVPDENGFTLSARVPIKQLLGDNFLFSMVPNDRRSAVSENLEGVLVETGGVFDRLDQLQTARLRVINGQSIIVTGRFQGRRGNDRNP